MKSTCRHTYTCVYRWHSLSLFLSQTSTHTHHKNMMNTSVIPLLVPLQVSGPQSLDGPARCPPGPAAPDAHMMHQSWFWVSSCISVYFSLSVLFPAIPVHTHTPCIFMICCPSSCYFTLCWCPNPRIWRVKAGITPWTTLKDILLKSCLVVLDLSCIFCSLHLYMCLFLLLPPVSLFLFPVEFY